MTDISKPAPETSFGRPWEVDVARLWLLIVFSASVAVGLTIDILASFVLKSGLHALAGEAIAQFSLLATLLALLAAASPRGELAGKLGLRKVRGRDIGIVFAGLIAIYAMQIVSTALWEKVLRAFALQTEERQELLKYCAGGSWRQYLPMVAIFGILIPLSEEMLFRRLIFGMLRPAGVWPALILTALLFSAAHRFLHGFAALAMMGAVFQLQYLWTGNLLTPTLTHMTYNIISLTLVFFCGL